MKTLLVSVGCGEVLDLLPGFAGSNPGRCSLRLACPGLHYAALSGLKKSEESRRVTFDLLMKDYCNLLQARIGDVGLDLKESEYASIQIQRHTIDCRG